MTERRTSLGHDWHPECLRCEECGKRLNPGQHAEHKGVPYCHIPCYGALFGPTLFGHGSRVESHTSFGKIENRQATSVSRGHVEAKFKIYNQYYEGKSGELKCRERNGRLILEGVLRIYWGVHNPIHLKEEHDARIPICKRNSCRASLAVVSSPTSSDDDNSQTRCKSLPSDVKYRTLPSRLNSADKSERADTLKDASPTPSSKNIIKKSQELTSAFKPKLRRRRQGATKLKRRCSINGHFYNRETSVFTPAYGSVTHVWVTSLVNTTEVINLLLDKFKVEDSPQDFALFIVRDNGERRCIETEEYPLLTRVILGPHEDVAKVFIMNKTKTDEISPEVAQYIQLSEPELKAIVDQFFEEEAREVQKIKLKYLKKQRELECYKIQLDLLQSYGLYDGHRVSKSETDFDDNGATSKFQPSDATRLNLDKPSKDCEAVGNESVDGDRCAESAERDIIENHRL
ncbi:RASSF2 (predicted) [Pycnogonum litorale]